MEQQLVRDRLLTTKRYLIHYVLGIALISLIYKLITHMPIHIMTTMTETYIIISWLFFNLILFAKKYGVTDHDIALTHEIDKWSSFSFYIIMFGAMFVLLFSKLFLTAYDFTSTYTLITSMTLGGFIISEYAAKKGQTSINQPFIDLDSRSYRNKVINLIGRLWLIALGYGVLMSSLSLTVKTPWEVVVNLWIFIFVMTIGISIQYFFLSIYEKIDYEEKEQGIKYMTEKVMLLIMPVIFFWIINQIIVLISSMLYLNGHVNNMPIMDRILFIMNDYHLDFALIIFIVFLLIIKYLRKLGVIHKIFQMVGYVVIVLSLLLNVMSVGNTYQNLNHTATNGEIFLDIFYYGSMIVNLMLFGLSIWLAVMLKKIRFPRLWMFVLIALIFPLVDLFILLFVNITGSYLMNYLVWFRSNIVYLIQYSALGVLSCLLLDRSTHTSYMKQGVDQSDTSI